MTTDTRNTCNVAGVAGATQRTPADRQRIGEALAAAWALRRRDLTPAILELFDRALAAYTADEILDALTRHVRNPDSGQWAPQPADLIRILDGSTETRALTAWADVARALRHASPYESVTWDDPTTRRVLADMGGWIALCRTSDAELPFKAREFQARYRGYAQAGATPDAPAYLPGLAEASAARHGATALPPPRRIPRGPAALTQRSLTHAAEEGSER